MIELLAGILIGGTIVTAIWITDLKHIVKHNKRVSDVLWAEIERKHPDIAEWRENVENGLTGELSAVEIARSRT